MGSGSRLRPFGLIPAGSPRRCCSGQTLTRVLIPLFKKGEARASPFSEREGFEPSVPVRVLVLSRDAPSATQPSFHCEQWYSVWTFLGNERLLSKKREGVLLDEAGLIE